MGSSDCKDKQNAIKNHIGSSNESESAGQLEQREHNGREYDIRTKGSVRERTMGRHKGREQETVPKKQCW